MNRVPTAMGLCLAVALAAGCGGGDSSTTSTTPATSTPASGASGVAGPTPGPGSITADALVSCLQGVGVDASISPNSLAGVTGDYQVVQESDTDIAAVFSSAAEAGGQDTAVGLYVDNPTLAGNAYYGGPKSDASAVANCLPSG